MTHEPSALQYAILEGGLIQNDPGIPYYDLDILTSENPGNDEAFEALHTWKMIMEFIVENQPHPRDHGMLYDAQFRLEAFIIEYGNPDTRLEFATAHQKYQDQLAFPRILPTNRVHLTWICQRCDTSQDQPLDNVAEAGGLICESCDDDMELSPYVTVS